MNLDISYRDGESRWQFAAYNYRTIELLAHFLGVAVIPQAAKLAAKLK